VRRKRRAAQAVLPTAAQLADREAIRHCILRYCRGLDRLDEDVLRGVYWPDATDDHLAYSGSAEGFIELARDILSTVMPRTQHLLGNILIEMLDNSRADVESYFQAYHLMNDENGGNYDLFVAGRYVDRLEKRDDEWRIADRAVIVDWFRKHEDTHQFGDKKPLGITNARPGHELGARKPDDRSYKLMA
jgi:SnoaL-like protein